MLKTLIINTFSVGFLFHWLISDSHYWANNPVTHVIAYLLFTANLLAIAWGYNTFTKNNKISQALDSLDSL